MSNFKLSVLSAGVHVLEDTVDMVVLPGLFGDIGISGGERVFVNLLTNGILYIFQGSKVSNRYYLFNGRFQFKDDTLWVNTEYELLNLDEFNNDIMRDKIQTFKDLLRETKDNFLKHYYEKQIDLCEKAVASVGINLYR